MHAVLQNKFDLCDAIHCSSLYIEHNIHNWIAFVRWVASK